MTLVIGIPACATMANGRPVHVTPARYAAAVVGGVEGLPIMIPPVGLAQLALLDRIDGLLLPGSPSNVHPRYYEGGDSETPDSHDLDRDATTLPLIRAAIQRGLPVLAICRGLQELNVALGGTLTQRVHLLPGRLDHRGGSGTLAERYAPKHGVRVSGQLARIVAAAEITVNSVHGQAIDRPAEGLTIEALAPDGTIEAVGMPHAPGFVLGVQWHPEWRYAEQPASVAIFRAFGDACRRWRTTTKRAA